MDKLESAKQYIKEVVEFSDSPWIEGWICGYSDGDEELKSTLLEYLQKLRE